MHDQYGVEDDKVFWGYTKRNNLQSNFLAECDEIEAISLIPPDKRLSVEEKDWIICRCRRCEYITHAIPKHNNEIVAIVTNLSNDSAVV